jgi:MYXO-CTERM domain-containing protein
MHRRRLNPTFLKLFASLLVMSPSAYAAPIVNIPASSRIGANGRIGTASPRVGSVGTYRGACSKWVKLSLTQADPILDTNIKGERLLDNVPPTLEFPAVPEPLAGDQSRADRKGRFYARAPVLDFDQAGVPGIHSPSRPLPWDQPTCRLQGTYGTAPDVSSLGPALAARFRGNLHIETAGVYTFAIRSDDGYRLRIGEIEIQSYNGVRAPDTDTSRARFGSPGVYPFEILYFDRGSIAALEVLVAAGDICFAGAPDFAVQAPCTTGTDVYNDNVPASAFAGVFQALDYHRLDLPTWVTSSSDPAFTVTDETCATEEPDQTCGPLQAGSCGNGIRERVNTGTLGSPTFADEQCDDGNLISGDGCSSTCTTETNFNCGAGSISTCTLPAPIVVAPAHDQTIDTTNPTYTGNVPGLASAAGYFIDLNLDGALLPGCTGIPLTQGNGGAFSCTPAAPVLTNGSHSIFAILRFGTTHLTPGEDNIFTVALSPPNTTIDSGPSGSVTTSNAAFTFSSDKSPVTFECKVDGAAAFSSCSSPLLLSGLSAGAHSLTVRAVSVTRGIDSTPAVRNWTVSLPPGAPLIALPVDGKAINTPGPECVGTAPAGATVNVYLDNATTPTCSATADASGAFRCTLAGPLSDGTHSVSARALNSLGTESPSSSINNFIVDTVPPQVSLAAPTGSTFMRRPTFEGTTEPGATVRVYLDQERQPLCTEAANVGGSFRCVPLTDLAIGQHLFTAEAEDLAGNISTRLPPQAFTILASTTEVQLLRIVEPSEGAVTSLRPRLAGVGVSGTEVDVFLDETKFCRARVDTDGTWNCAVETDLSPGGHVVSARTRPDGTSAALEHSVHFTVRVGDAQHLAVGCGCNSDSEVVWALLAIGALVSRRQRRAH